MDIKKSDKFYSVTIDGGTSSLSTTGTVRNRTDAFLKYRRQARGLSKPVTGRGRLPGTSSSSDVDGSETARLMASALGGTLPSSSSSSPDAAETCLAGMVAALPPAYVEFKEQIRTEMGGIRQKMGELRALHGKAALSRFDDARDDEVAVEVITQQITRMFRKCEGKLQQFAGNNRGITSSSLADQKVKQNVQRTLAVELQRLSLDFRKQQKDYLARLRTKGGGGGSSSNKSSSAAAALSLLDGSESKGGGDDAFFDPGFSDIQALQADSLTSVIEERDQEVAKILGSIHELAQIMKDLSVLVIDQGTILDRIDYNLENTGSRMQEGVVQLKKAERAQRRGVAAMCVTWLLVAIAVVFIVLVFKIIVF